MSFLTPTTRVTGDLIDPTVYNGDVINNLVFLRRNMITGRVTGATGAIVAGSGFTCSRTATGTYRITYPGFTSGPMVQILASGANGVAGSLTVATGTCDLRMQSTFAGGGVDIDFTFIAIGII